MMKEKLQTGFSLIELMIVVAIVGILASIAYPSYQEHVAQSRRVDAQANLLTLAQYMERHFTEEGRFDQNQDGSAHALPFNKSPRDGADLFYNINVVSAASSYALSAVPAGVMNGDTCGVMTVDHRGFKSAAGGSDCWQ